MQTKSVLVGIVLAGLSAMCWGFLIALGFWLCHRFITQPTEVWLDERKGKKIANEMISEIEKECKF